MLGVRIGGFHIRSGGLVDIRTKVQIRRYNWPIGVRLGVATEKHFELQRGFEYQEVGRCVEKATISIGPNTDCI